MEGIVVRGTITDSDGHFILSPLEQSSAVGNYDVVIAGATTATNIVSDVPVSAQTTTSLSTADVPFVLMPLRGGVGTIKGRPPAAAAVPLAALPLINGSPCEAIGRAPCGDRVCRYVECSVVALARKE